MRYKLLFTGGHHNSALAVIRWLMSNNYNVSIEWIGDQLPSNGVIYPEYKAVSDLKIAYHKITAGKIFRFSSLRFLPIATLSFLKIPIGFFQAVLILIFNRPDLIVSFGGFIAVPVVVAGKILGIRSVTHEQTVVIGLANKIIARFVDKIYVSWPVGFYDTKKDIKNKMVYTGLPIDLSYFKTSKHLKFSEDLKTIYIAGGKKGSLSLNEWILSNLDFFVNNFNIIWSCGNTKGKYGYEGIYAEIAKLNENLRKRIFLKEYFFEGEIGTVFNSFDFMISRSGAHTVYELAILRKPCILIPIPWSSNDEQRKNAEVLVKVGLAEIIEESCLSKPDFKSIIIDFSDRLEIRRKTFNLNSLSEIVTSKGQENLGNEIIKIIKAKDKKS